MWLSLALRPVAWAQQALALGQRIDEWHLGLMTLGQWAVPIGYDCQMAIGQMAWGHGPTEYQWQLYVK